MIDMIYTNTYVYYVLMSCLVARARPQMIGGKNILKGKNILRVDVLLGSASKAANDSQKRPILMAKEA